MEARIADQVISYRQKVCPRTSYASGGSAASVLYFIQVNCSTDLMVSWNNIQQIILAKKEFDDVKSFASLVDCKSALAGHVVIVVGILNNVQQDQLKDIVSKNDTSLAFYITPLKVNTAHIGTDGLEDEVDKEKESDKDDDDNSDDEESSFNLRKKHNIKTLIQDYPESNIQLTIYSHFVKSSLRVGGTSTPAVTTQSLLSTTIAATSTTTMMTTATAFNGQPTTSSRRQFAFLWGKYTPTSDNSNNNNSSNITEEMRLEGKRRVLQRLENKNILLKKKSSKTKKTTITTTTSSNSNSSNGIKMTKDDWDAIIEDGLTNQSLNDYGIYNLIREATLGNTIQQSLAASSSSSSAASTATVAAGMSTEDERADHLVDLTMSCLPQLVRDQPRKYIQNMLDYGCAEGNITSSLGARLGLTSHEIYGADVRQITTKDFMYLPLPAEEPTVTTGQKQELLLPSIPDHSIYLINLAMVLHHVIHVERVLLELRRIIHPSGVIILREHDNQHGGTACFLDILHGFFALAWKESIEWPQFIEEYAAYYRSKEQWNELFARYGMKLRPAQPKLYHHSETSTWRIASTATGNGYYPNVTRAYYAIYLVDNTTPLPMQIQPIPSSSKGITSHNESKQSHTEIQEETAIEPAKKRKKSVAIREENSMTRVFDYKQPVVVSSSSSSSAAEEQVELILRNDYLIYESRQYPGKYFKFYPANSKVHWIHPIPPSPPAAAAVSSRPMTAFPPPTMYHA